MGDARDTKTPNIEAITLWLKNGLSRDFVHDQGWKDVNCRYNSYARAIRPYILDHFPPEEQEAAFDGFTLALMTLAHFEDIEKLSKQLNG